MAEASAGLTEAEARVRLAAGQDNTTNVKPRRTLHQARRESVFTVFNLNMVGLVVIQMLLSEWIGAGVTVLMFGVSLALRTLQESLADKRIDAVRDAARVRATVIRDGRQRPISSDDVVPGDLLVVTAGDQFQVDGVVTGTGVMIVDSSPITGRRGWTRVTAGDEVLAGSICLSGRGRYVATRVGDERLIHARLALRSEAASRPTPLERVVAKILTALLVVVVVYAGILLAKYFKLDVGEPGDAFIDAAPVIFSLIPTGLYLMIIVAYATGTADLARLGAIVQSARSVELLAESTVLCVTDVGLLSGTSMRVTPLLAPPGEQDWPDPSDLHRTLGDVARSTSHPGPVSEVIAGSFDGEAVAVAVEQPHLATLGWSALAFDDPDDAYVYVLGEPRLFDITPGSEDSLVLARGPQDASFRDADGRPQLPAGLVPLGLLERSPVLHPEALSVVRGFVESGVRIKVFAPDEPGDVLAALRQAGLSEADERHLLPEGGLSRAQLEALPRDQWAQAARDHRLFGGLTPDQVGDLVSELRVGGAQVTVVGDSLSDLPAMQAAHLSVAQRASSQAALGLADIVLLNDTTDVLLSVLRRGQAIVRGLLDVIKLNLSIVVCSALLIGFVRLFGVGFPYVSGQGSIISILAVTVPSVLLPLWARPAPVSSGRYLPLLARFVLPSGVLLSLATFGVYLTFMARTGDVRLAQFAVTYTLLYAGLALSVLIQPPLPGPGNAHTWRTAALAAGLALVGTLVPLVPLGRRQFRIEFLPHLSDYLVVGAAVACWALLLHLVWRAIPRADLA
ncbi:hypothetical protein G7070_07920 [Propioniciclava coleopterorum]|uniref:P-type ATPase A domain-containing protein n=1 Tax=Propioniciclava coleopterorum TaxID=2714937 RepID=A0A6G7Y6D5_9ACTN|nr:hypothetical protein [Propioniciclava coleopterorum]QIK72208.1 hypothetical protein G7070_07920 [Propioniciclava coleopterorum]